MSSPDPISIVISDDHAVLRAGMEAILKQQSDFKVIGAAADGEEGVALCLKERPDVAIFDLKMPRLGGFEALGRLKAEMPNLPCVIVTSFDNEEDVHRCIRAGARGYLLKDAPIRDIVDCVRTVARGGRFIPANVAARLASRMDAESLTERELAILRFMASGQSNKRIARSAHISEGTVKFHVNNILTKLGADSRTGAVADGLRRRLIAIE